MHPPKPSNIRARSAPDWPFWLAFGLIAALYAALICGMLLADAQHTSVSAFLQALHTPEIQFSIKLTLISCTAAAVLSLLVSVPIGYLLSRGRFLGKRLLDVLFDVPLVLPPLVIGISLLILFQTPAGRAIESHIRFTYAVPGLILAQFVVACSLSVRTMRSTFDHLPARCEAVALTLGCSRASAFWRVALPSAWRGALTAFTIAWARSMGEFGPVLVFAGTTRFKTEVLPTTIFLELSVGNLETAVAVSLLMAGMGVAVLTVIRWAGEDSNDWT